MVAEGLGVELWVVGVSARNKDDVTISQIFPSIKNRRTRHMRGAQEKPAAYGKGLYTGTKTVCLFRRRKVNLTAQDSHHHEFLLPPNFLCMSPYMCWGISRSISGMHVLANNAAQNMVITNEAHCPLLGQRPNQIWRSEVDLTTPS